MIHAVALTLTAFVPTADPTAADIVQSKFEDAIFTAKVVTGNQAELAKISDDFGNSYRLKVVKSFLKEPLKMRLETKVDETNLLMVIANFKRSFRVPRFPTSDENLADKPGKMQTPMDYGLITSSMMSELFTAKYVRTDRASGDYVFDMTYKTPKYSDTSRHRIWVDPQKRVISKREWYNQYGRQRATFFYEEPMLRDGVWFPSRGTVRNMDGKIAGVIEYQSVKINSGLADSLFKI